MVNRSTSTRPSREERRQQLLHAAVDAIRTIGPNASMEQLAAQGGVTKPILYRHFGDREGLGRAIGEHYATVLFARLQGSLDADAAPRDLLWRTVDTYLAFLEEEPQLYTFLSSGSGARPDLEEAGAIVNAVARQVSGIISDRLLAAGLDTGGAEPFAFGIVGMVHQAGDWWIRTRTMSRSALTGYLTTLLWSGFEGIARDASADPAAVFGAHVD
ncbi:MAG TPA: TetR/AcrR family transcriptional regulator [Acidimicrobiales bacterium]|nr:TetR/AcrR family transcriptional regulator [Acidimicrobiales bacterium]